jgi:hypothetical protein
LIKLYIYINDVWSFTTDPDEGDEGDVCTVGFQLNIDMALPLKRF